MIKDHKIATAVIFCFLAMLGTVDLIRASIGVSSFIEFTHFEFTAGVEFYAIIVFLVLSFQRLRAAKVKLWALTFIYFCWISIAAAIFAIASNHAKSIVQHWDDQVLRLVHDGRAADIQNVDWGKDVPSNRVGCIIIGKDRIRIFNVFKYHITCAGNQLKLDVKLTMNNLVGKASAYVELIQ